MLITLYLANSFPLLFSISNWFEVLLGSYFFKNSFFLSFSRNWDLGNALFMSDYFDFFEILGRLGIKNFIITLKQVPHLSVVLIYSKVYCRICFDFQKHTLYHPLGNLHVLEVQFSTFWRYFAHAIQDRNNLGVLHCLIKYSFFIDGRGGVLPW